MNRANRVLALAALSLLLAPRAFPESSGVSQAARDHGSSAPPSTSKESAGNGGEDETAQFRHSASVELLGKLTGLGSEGAYWVAVVANFAIVVAVLAWFSKKNLPALFRGRTAGIQKALEEARRVSQDANRRLTEIESRLARLDDEISQMRGTMEKEAETEEARIRTAAEEQARRIVESAEQEIATSARAARRELTEYAADLAVSLAGQRIRVDSSTDQMLVRRFLQQLATDGRSGKT
jgi:F-type H+-transporting ATPase subunit b